MIKNSSYNCQQILKWNLLRKNNFENKNIKQRELR